MNQGGDSIPSSIVPSLSADVSTLLGHRDVEMGLTCLGSLAIASREPLRLRVHDGTLTEQDRERLTVRLPGCVFIERNTADEQIDSLATDSRPEVV